MGRRGMLVACGCALIIGGLVGHSAEAQTSTVVPGVHLAQADEGDLLVHGNYCGPGNRGWNVRPIDALDAACARHDACTPDGALPSCGCNKRLQFEASAVANSPRQPDDLRAMAGLVSAAAALMPCRSGG